MNKIKNRIQIKLRRVKSGGKCLANGCDNENCDELFIIGVEDEALAMNRLLVLECLCEECALFFIDDLIKQCKSLGNQLVSKDYVIEEADIYEQPIIASEIVIQDAVKASFEPADLYGDFNDEPSFDNDFDNEVPDFDDEPSFDEDFYDEEPSFDEDYSDEPYFDEGFESEDAGFNEEGGDNMSDTKNLIDLEGYEDYEDDFADAGFNPDDVSTETDDDLY